MIDKFASDDKLQEGTSVECEESTAGPSWKKAKIDSDVACSSRNREIQQFRCLSVASDDLLEWWKQQSGTFPRLSRLARSILAVPATSTPSERVFSIAGLTLLAKRSSLAPHTVSKIIFVHDNDGCVGVTGDD